MKEKIKVCTKCGEAKPPTEFHKQRARKDGLASACKECARTASKLSRIKFKEKRKIYRKKHYEENRKQHDEAVKKWKAKNKSKVADIHKRCYAKYKKINGHKIKPARKLREAVRRGKITRPNECQVCNKTEPVICGHHEDYTKPYAVVWMCCSCHTIYHKGYDQEAEVIRVKVKALFARPEENNHIKEQP